MQRTVTNELPSGMQIVKIKERRMSYNIDSDISEQMNQLTVTVLIKLHSGCLFAFINTFFNNKNLYKFNNIPSIKNTDQILHITSFNKYTYM